MTSAAFTGVISLVSRYPDEIPTWKVRRGRLSFRWPIEVILIHGSNRKTYVKFSTLSESGVKRGFLFEKHKMTLRVKSKVTIRQPAVIFAFIRVIPAVFENELFFGLRVVTVSGPRILLRGKTVNPFIEGIYTNINVLFIAASSGTMCNYCTHATLYSVSLLCFPSVSCPPFSLFKQIFISPLWW